MLTWETLTECIQNDCVDDDLLLICELLVKIHTILHIHAIANMTIERLFDIHRDVALNTPIKYYRDFFNRL